MQLHDKRRFKTYHAERKISYDDAAYFLEREQCERERAANCNNNGNGSNAPENFCYCRELVVNGRRVPCPPWHNCTYVARRSALVDEAAELATKKCGNPIGDKNRGYHWTKIFNQEITRLAAPLLRQ